MVCKNCGKKLKRNDKFCSQCGTAVAEEALNDNADNMGNISSENMGQGEAGAEQSFGFEIPKEEFNWNVHTFPGAVPTKTEDVDFDWKLKDEEFKSRPKEEPEIAFSPTPPAERWSVLEAEEEQRRIQAEKEAAEEKSRKVAEMIKQREEERRLDEEIEQKAKIAADAREAAERREREAAEAEEERKALAEVVKKAQEEKASVEKEMAEKIAQEAAEKERLIASEKAHEVVEEKIMEEAKKEAAADEKGIIDFRQNGNEMIPTENDSDISGKDLEKELFGGAAVVGVENEGEGLSRHTAKIDKFYTINQKNKEFQKLLDREYEKVKGGKPLDDDVFAADVKKIKEEVEDPKKTQIFPPASQVEEMAKAREALLGKTAEIEVPLFGNANEEKEANYTVENSGENVDKTGENFFESSDAPKIPVPDRPFDSFLTDDEPGEDIEDMKSVPEAVKDIPGSQETSRELPVVENSPKQKRGIFAKIIILILLIILFTLLGALAMKYFAPDHQITQEIDSITDKIISIFMMITPIGH